MSSDLYQQIYAVVRQVPAGKVVTYGQVAGFIGRARAARQVGYAMAACPQGEGIPWHRVINAKGEISARGDGTAADYQRQLLEEEGVAFDLKGRICLKTYQWWP